MIRPDRPAMRPAPDFPNRMGDGWRPMLNGRSRICYQTVDGRVTVTWSRERQAYRVETSGRSPEYVETLRNARAMVDEWRRTEARTLEAS